MPVTQTGMTEARRTVERLPQVMRSALRAVAMRSAHRIAHNAADILRQKTSGTGATAEAIRVREDDQAFLVESKAPQGKPANLPVWLEFGTVHMSARPYMRPAAESESPRYAAGMKTAVVRAAGEVGL